MSLKLRWKRSMRVAMLYGLLVLLISYIFLPFVWAFLTTIKYESEIYTYIPKLIPQSVTLHRYIAFLTGEERYITSPGQIFTGESLKSFIYGFINSMIVSISVTLLCLLIGSIAAYSFARLRFRGRNALFMLILLFRFMPVIALAIPLYMIAQDLALMDTKQGLIVVYCSFVLPFVIWMLKTYFETIPTELEDAAKLDGCGSLGILFRVILPVSIPGLAATGILAFMSAWSEFLLALILTASTNSKTITVAISEFSGQHGMDYGMICTGGIISAIPPIMIALLFQKYIVKGFMMGALKK